MTSILNNTAATNALATLRSINSQLDANQQRISTGKAVSSAKDNAAYWSISQTMNSDIKSMDTINSLLGTGAAKVDIAAAGMDEAINAVTKIKDLLLSAKEPTADKVLIQTEIKQLQDSIVTTSKSASFNGINMLYKGATGAGAGIQSITAGISRDSTGTLSTISIDVDSSQTQLIDAATAANGLLSKDRTGTNSNNVSIIGGANNITLTATTTNAQLSDMIEAVEGALKDMTKGASVLGSVSKRIENQGEFLKKMVSTFEKGVSRLVDADMERESAKSASLKVQQQLAVQALSIANDNPNSILQLFR